MTEWSLEGTRGPSKIAVITDHAQEKNRSRAKKERKESSLPSGNKTKQRPQGHEEGTASLTKRKNKHKKDIPSNQKGGA